MSDSKENIQLNLDVTPRFLDLITELTEETGEDVGDLLRKAVILLGLAMDTVRSGGTVTLNEARTPGGPLVPREVVGLVSPGAVTPVAPKQSVPY